MRNIQLIIEYDGSRYDGWQKAVTAAKNAASAKGGAIQEKIEEVLNYIEKNDYQKIDSLLNYCNNVRVVETYSYLLVSEPQFSHEGGFYKEIIPLKIHCNEGETIYYTMDGSIPTVESKVYSGIIFLESGEYEIKAVCVNKYGIVGKVITKEYQIEF